MIPKQAADSVTGKVFPLTVITPIRFGGRRLTHVVLWIYSKFKFLAVKQLRFIHFARWLIIKLPQNQEIFGYVKTKHRYFLLFTSNFNGPWEHYIDSFSLVPKIRPGMNFVWFTSQGFPGAKTLRRFKHYIRYHEYVPDYYYIAYPHATVRDIEAAMFIQKAAESLDQIAQSDDAALFRQTFDRFLQEHSQHLIFIDRNPNLWSDPNYDETSGRGKAPSYRDNQPFELDL